ncbi:protein of unknown function [Candidatus Promineifilum breve]|uniref:Minor tail T domain-containing protein n=1 Tax=Candidatus Promineifilum breve TaxID=1806508 RepID=A0A170PHD6_9CHLR|nr:DUF4035 domain-containing protein [Candidatus Promineifilum breve]CUS04243.2 protein of unknown function [Candidatus Promineifilum breve]
MKCELAYHWRLTLAEVDSTFSGSEIATWEAVRDLAPFGLRGEWVRSAALQALVANVNRDAKRRPQPYTLNDFLPEWLRYGAAEDGSSVDAMMAYLNTTWE